MTVAAGRGLRIESDLRLDVDGLTATVLADGQQLTVTTRDAGQLLARAGDIAPSVLGAPVTATSLPALLRRVGHLLDEAGLSARVLGERGAVIELGRGCDSRLGRVLLGTDHVRLGRVDAMLAELTQYARAAWITPTRVRSAAGGLAIGVAVIGAARRRRSIGR